MKVMLFHPRFYESLRLGLKTTTFIPVPEFLNEVLNQPDEENDYYFLEGSIDDFCEYSRGQTILIPAAPSKFELVIDDIGLKPVHDIAGQEMIDYGLANAPFSHVWNELYPDNPYKDNPWAWKYTFKIPEDMA